MSIFVILLGKFTKSLQVIGSLVFCVNKQIKHGKHQAIWTRVTQHFSIRDYNIWFSLGTMYAPLFSQCTVVFLHVSQKFEFLFAKWSPVGLICVKFVTQSTAILFYTKKWEKYQCKRIRFIWEKNSSEIHSTDLPNYVHDLREGWVSIFKTLK